MSNHVPPGERADDELFGEQAEAALASQLPRLHVPEGTNADITNIVATAADDWLPGAVYVTCTVTRSRFKSIRLRLKRPAYERLLAQLQRVKSR